MKLNSNHITEFSTTCAIRLLFWALDDIQFWTNLILTWCNFMWTWHPNTQWLQGRGRQLSKFIPEIIPVEKCHHLWYNLPKLETIRSLVLRQSQYLHYHWGFMGTLLSPTLWGWCHDSKAGFSKDSSVQEVLVRESVALLERIVSSKLQSVSQSVSRTYLLSTYKRPLKMSRKMHIMLQLCLDFKTILHQNCLWITLFINHLKIESNR